jgi:hypothetical protein
VRKFLATAMPILMILCILTGIVESMPFHWGRPPELHIFVAMLFIATACVHAGLNRNAFIKYFKWAYKGRDK